MKIKVAVIDDHFAIRDGYKALLQSFAFVGQVDAFSNSIDFYSQLKNRAYDLVIIDIELKGENGLDLCKNLKQLKAQIKVLILSSYHSEEYIMNAYENNADGYLFKDTDAKEVKRAVEEMIFHNKKFFEDEAIRVIFNLEEARKKNHDKIKVKLTEREMEIIYHIVHGKSNKEIGVILNVAETTISTHKQNIMKKLNAHKTIDLFRFASETGLITTIKNKEQ